MSGDECPTEDRERAIANRERIRTLYERQRELLNARKQKTEE